MREAYYRNPWPMEGCFDGQDSCLDGDNDVSRRAGQVTVDRLIVM